MVGLFPVIGDDSKAGNIAWIGEESDRRMCGYCKTTKLNRVGRFFICPSCNQRFDVADTPEEIRVDLNVSKLDVHPALVFKDKLTEDEIRSTNTNDLMKKYKLKGDDFDDLARLKRAGITIKSDIEHK